jgi:hypothetical protein
MQLREDQDELDRIGGTTGEFEYAEANEVAERGRRNALLANIGLGAALASGTVAAILFYRDRRDRGPAVTPVRGGAAVTWEVSF